MGAALAIIACAPASSVVPMSLLTAALFIAAG